MTIQPLDIRRLMAMLCTYVSKAMLRSSLSKAVLRSSVSKAMLHLSVPRPVRQFAALYSSRAAIARLVAIMVVAAACAPAPTSVAQDRYVELAARNLRPVVLHEAISVPGPVGPQTVIAFSVPNSLLVFVQGRQGFTSNAEVGVEVFHEGRKLREETWRGEKQVGSFEQTQSRSDDLSGEVALALEPGEYRYRLTLTNGGADGGPSTTDRSFEVPAFDHPEIGRPFFVYGVERDSAGTTLDPVHLGGSAPFGEAGLAAVPIAAAEGELRYRLFEIGEGTRRSSRRDSERPALETGRFEPGTGDRLVREGAVPVDAAITVGALRDDCLCWSDETTATGRVALVDLDTETLENAEHVLEIVLETPAGTVDRLIRFRTFWRDMPLSLYDHRVAIRNLSFIEDRDAVRSMLQGSREDQIAAFRTYWKQRDPTPETVFNELMAEYYRRVDHAAFEFRTGKTGYPDGLRTDAARIYIVHGPPSDISSTFPSTGGVQQTWTYPDGRRFVFWAASSLAPLELEEATNGG